MVRVPLERNQAVGKANSSSPTMCPQKSSCLHPPWLFLLKAKQTLELSIEDFSDPQLKSEAAESSTRKKKLDSVPLRMQGLWRGGLQEYTVREAWGRRETGGVGTKKMSTWAPWEGWEWVFVPLCGIREKIARLRCSSNPHPARTWIL